MDISPTEKALLRGAHLARPESEGHRSAPRRLEEIYLEHAPVMRRVAIRKFRVPTGDADALVHDVFVAYLANPARVQSNLQGYLVAAICNAARKYWRSKSYDSRLFSDEETTTDAPSTEDTFGDLARNLTVAATLARLAPKCREVLRRYYLDGEDTETIAAALQTSPGNVNYIMHTCRLRARAVHEEMSRQNDPRS